MATDFPQMRFDASQVSQIAAARELRHQANQLLSKIAHGRYDDDDLEVFYDIASRINEVLYVSSSEVAERAGVGASYLPSLIRDRRRPKLKNFQTTLSSIIAFANERLKDIDTALQATNAEQDAQRGGAGRYIGKPYGFGCITQRFSHARDSKA